jgi:subtilisin family serine protease
VSWIRLLRIVTLVVSAFAAASFGPATAGSPDSSPGRQILVMVRHPPDHYRAGGAYGGSYGDELARSARQRLARSIARRYNLAFVDNWPMPMIGVDCFVMVAPAGRSTSAMAEQVSHDADVAWAEPVELYSARSDASPPNDPLYAAQPAARQWHLADLHQIASGRGIRVAVIDSAIDSDHPDLAGQLLINRNFVAGQPFIPEQHGTAVAGIIAAKTDNHIGISGVAPGAKLLGLRACWQIRGSPSGATSCDTLSLAKALYFATQNHPDVINLSLSGPDARLLRALLGLAMDQGSAVVGAVDPKAPGGGFPASVPGVIAVTDTLAGARGDVYIAPGRDVPTTQPGGRWFLVNGSSFAAAHVSGLVALMRERRRALPIALVSQRHGGGLIDACATMVRVTGGCDCACSSARVFRTSAGR